jgi:hypothetical protein
MVRNALNSELITIQSKGLVLRSYVDFKQLFKALLQDISPTVVSSSGEIIEIRELAKLVIETLNSKSQLKFNPVDSKAPTNSYLPPDESMNLLFAAQKMEVLPLKAQIEQTAIGVKGL